MTDYKDDGQGASQHAPGSSHCRVLAVDDAPWISLFGDHSGSTSCGTSYSARPSCSVPSVWFRPAIIHSGRSPLLGSNWPCLRRSWSFLPGGRKNHHNLFTDHPSTLALTQHIAPHTLQTYWDEILNQGWNPIGSHTEKYDAHVKVIVRFQKIYRRYFSLKHIKNYDRPNKRLLQPDPHDIIHIRTVVIKKIIERISGG